jgi:hypothetical protein
LLHDILNFVAAYDARRSVPAREPSSTGAVVARSYDTTALLTPIISIADKKNPLFSAS